MRSRLRQGLIVAGIALCACTFDSALPPEPVLLACSAPADCPDGQDCVRGQCLPLGAEALALAALTVALDEDTAASFTLTAVGVDASSAAFHVTEPPARGRLICADDVEVCASGCADVTLCLAPGGTLTYRPNEHEHGQDSFVAVVENTAVPVLAGGGLLGAPSVVTLEIAPVNDAPTWIGAPGLAVPEDEAAVLALFDAVEDADRDALTFTLAAEPAHGTAEVTGGILLLRASEPNYSGADSLTVRVDDGNAAIDVVLAIDVTPVNDTPVAVLAGGAVVQGEILPIELGGDDLEGDALTLSILSPPAEGSFVVDVSAPIALAAGRVQLPYQAPTDYAGAVQLSYSVSDGQAQSAPQLVELQVLRALRAQSGSVVVLEDTEQTVSLVAQADGLVPTILITTAPAHGTAEMVGVDVARYRPAADYVGPDSFGFVAADGRGTSAEATLSITVAPVNDPPVALPAAAAVVQTQVVDIEIGGTDVDGDALDAEILTAPASGSLDVPARVPFALDANRRATLRYTAPVSFSGTVAFTYLVRDRNAPPAQSATEVVEILVARRLVAFPPGTPVVLDEDQDALIELSGQADGSTPTFAIAAFPANGVLEFVDASHVRYRPALDFNGTDAFEFIAQDGVEVSARATVAITVLPVNDAPIFVGLSATVDEEGTLVAGLTADDVDLLDVLTFEVDDTRPPALGAAAVVDGVLTYVPAPDRFGSDVFAVNCSDGTDTVQGLISIEVTNVQDVPVAIAPPQKQVTEDRASIISLGGSDVDGDTLEFLISTPPTHGTISELDAARGVLLYTPAPDYFGADSFRFIVDDGLDASGDAVVAINVLPVNDPPIITTSLVQLPAHQSVGVFPIAYFDPDGDTGMTLTVTSSPSRGMAEVDGGNIRYTRFGLSAYLDDAFTVRLTDPVGAEDSAAVNVELTSQPSCALILNTGASIGDTTHVIDPSPAGGSDRFLAHCDMTRAGGGWTLALRADGRLNNFGFWSGMWTSTSTFNADQPGPVTSLEGKLASFSSVPLTEVMVGMAPFVGVQVSGDWRYVVGKLAGAERSSLRSIIATSGSVALATAPTASPSPGRTRWLRLLTGATLQANCNDESVRGSSTSMTSLRIGILGNNETNCSSPDSFIGVGSNLDITSGQKNSPAPAVSVPAFTHVYVRSRDFTSLPSRVSCAAHAAAGARITGTFLVNGVAVSCDFGSTVLCGDTFIDPPEDCDDGNTFPWDGCDSKCRIPLCGNGRKEDTEECDDGNGSNDDSCTTICTLPRCGDTILSAPEMCDDGNMVDGDGCSRLCLAEVCGDGIRAGLEQCDDGDLDDNTNGCDHLCNNTCGNGAINVGEQCDDGNRTGFDSCSATCQVEPSPPTLLDDMEGGTGEWSTEIVSAPPFGPANDWLQTSARASSPSRSWNAAMWDSEGSTRLTSMPIDLTSVAPAARVRVGFSHFYQFLDCQDPLFQPDGGIIEISVDGGPFLQIEPEAGYPGEIQPVCGNPFEGRPAFTNDSGGFVTDTIDVTPYIGREIRIGFHAGWDCGNCEQREGWYVDDLRMLVE